MRKNKLIFFLILFFHLVILSKLQFTAWPEMISFPYFLNHGFVTYKDMVHAYPPLLINILAIVYKIFGYSETVVRLSGWSLILTSDFFLFLIILKLTKKLNFSLVMLFIYTIFQTFLEGNMIWPDLAIIPFVLASLYFLFDKKLFLTGIFIGFSVLTKQTGVFPGLAILLFIIIIKEKKSKILNYFLGVSTIFIPFIVSLVSQNSLSDFIRWAVIYPSQYWTKFPGYIQILPTTRQILIILVLLFPFIILTFNNTKIFKDKKNILFSLLFISAIVSIYPRFSFFHFQLGIAILVIFYSYALFKTKKFSNYYFLYFLVIVLLLSPKFINDWGKQTRFYDSDSLKLSQEIEKATNKNGKIYFLNIPSNFYVLTNHLPPKPWVDNFGWYFEIPSVQEDTINRWKLDAPQYIVWENPKKGNWFDLGVYEPQEITNWIKKNYNKEKQMSQDIAIWEKK